MSKQALALHLIEKGLYSENLSPIEGAPGEWNTGKWWIGDATARSLIGKKIYLHRGQLEKSHIGGEILSFQQSSTDPKKKIIRFRRLAECAGVSTSRTGWGNEKKIVWQSEE